MIKDALTMTVEAINWEDRRANKDKSFFDESGDDHSAAFLEFTQFVNTLIYGRIDY